MVQTKTQELILKSLEELEKTLPIFRLIKPLKVGDTNFQEIAFEVATSISKFLNQEIKDEDVFSPVAVSWILSTFFGGSF